MSKKFPTLDFFRAIMEDDVGPGEEEDDLQQEEEGRERTRELERLRTAKSGD